MDTRVNYDVTILGSGMASTTLALLLVRAGLSVGIIDKTQHPRFAIGESTVAQTSIMMKIMAHRFNVPELLQLGSANAIRENVSTSCGVKRNFGFVYHAPDGTQQMDQANQVAPTSGNDSESHLFRQDVDSHLLHLAVAAGVDVMQGASVENIELDDERVRVQLTGGTQLSSRFIVDGSGKGCVLARRLGLLKKEPEVFTHSRTVFTHMVGVRPYDECVTSKEGHQMPTPWFEGTLHHLFDGGWMWVIPFNNHEESRNSLCSVGLCLDPRKHPRPAGLSPEEDFRRFISRYPSIAAQFENAKAVRDWTSSDRVQHECSRYAGARYALLSHTGGFIDALFSRGLANSTQLINALVPRLVQACREDQFTEEQFEYINTLQRGLVAHNDKLVHGAFVSFSDYRLWNAWFRIWSISAMFGMFQLNRALTRYDMENTKKYFDDLDASEFPGSICPNHPGVNQLFHQAHDIMLAVERGDSTSAEGAEAIFALLKAADFLPPPMNLADENMRAVQADAATVKELVRWGKLDAPASVRDRYFDFNFGPLEPAAEAAP